ncbi:response regulator transcription factor [Clavibacter michiganensis subsp. phaseoli]|uniref:Response regulator transcription factor n=1 Tax=Clavibacter phaseoli TaxID=1734031 RepID=A0A8I0SC57_9MICO|nr:response regulator transcription factor [Clavibacter phaseoli]MBF4632751.1 response regulator transcription factor [Clavibacter phaseoli]
MQLYADPVPPTDEPDASTTRVVLADDSLLLREGLARLFAEAGYEVVDTYPDADALIRELDATRPNLAVLDIRMPPTFRDEGVRAGIAIKRTHPHVAVLLLSQYAEPEYAADLLGTGAHGVGYLVKDRIASLDELRDAVERLTTGGTVIDEAIVRDLIARRHDPLASLTAREVDILTLMTEGRTNRAIAASLFLSVATVEKHTTSIFAKLGLEDNGATHRRVLAVLAWLDQST